MRITQFRLSQITSKCDFQSYVSDKNLINCIKKLNGFPYKESDLKSKKNFFFKNQNNKNAAVLIPFCQNENNETSILFTLRSAFLANHKFEICFPGGKQCPFSDKGDLANTALRETVEEIGVSEDSIKIYGILSPFPRKKGNFVYPVLAKIDLTKQGINNKIFHDRNKDEVEDVILRPISKLIESKNWKFTHWKDGYSSLLYKDEVFNDKDTPRIWGLTCFFLYQILSNLIPDRFYVKYPSIKRYET